MNTKQGDNQIRFFVGNIPSPPELNTIWFHKQGKTLVSSSGKIPSIVFIKKVVLSCFRPIYGKKQDIFSSSLQPTIYPVSCPYLLWS